MLFGRRVRLKQICSNPFGNLSKVVIDHFVGYGNVTKDELANLPKSCELSLSGNPESVTIQRRTGGVAQDKLVRGLSLGAVK